MIYARLNEDKIVLPHVYSKSDKDDLNPGEVNRLLSGLD